MPYHETLRLELKHLKATHGYAILYDAHSIKSEVPRLFDGVLPDLNLGSANGQSCAPEMAAAALRAAENSGYSAVLDGRFVGGHITRHYGQPKSHVHAIQMELACKNYMQEDVPYKYQPEKAGKLQAALKDVLRALLEWGEKAYSPPKAR